MRSSRKVEHLQLAKVAYKGDASHFEDISLIPCALPDLNPEDVDTGCYFLGKKLAAPILINAMTGGHSEAEKINFALAQAAQKAGLAMAVGSQRSGLEDDKLIGTYTVVRRENPQGVVLANLNAGCTPSEALRAVEMLDADGIQLFLNPAHELAMPEGEPCFRGILENVLNIKERVDVPIIVKEVGSGLSGEIVASLRAAKVDFVDIGGRGGTNFIAIERMRGGTQLGEEMLSWGIPTAIALAEAVHFWPERVIASGGIRNGFEIAKALAIGAVLAGIAHPFLLAYEDGSEAVLKLALSLIRGLRNVMFLLGACDIETLKMKPVIITGYTREWLHQRGINTARYAQRGFNERCLVSEIRNNDR